MCKSKSQLFENLSDCLTEEAMSLPASVKKLIEEQLQGLKSHLCDFFPSPDVQVTWTKYLFANLCEGAVTSLSAKEHDSLIDLSCDSALK